MAIGKISVGKSFKGCISYLFDGKKKGTSEEQQATRAQKQAEVIAYNQCFGSPKQLIREFIEVSKLNPKVSKPVFHLSVSFAHADAGKLSQQDKADIAEQLAEAFKFKSNQYMVVAHQDTGHEHLHIVANRIGYDGRAATDSNSYQRIAKAMRQIEQAYQLTQVLSPNKFLKPQERIAKPQRIDQRREQLKRHLKEAIAQVENVQQLKAYMEQKGYGVELGRGIAFTDQQQVRFKGSQVGFALAEIQKQLQKQASLRQQQKVNDTAQKPTSTTKQPSINHQRQEPETKHKQSKGVRR